MPFRILPPINSEYTDRKIAIDALVSVLKSSKGKLAKLS
jgi:hypothetical protein